MVQGRIYLRIAWVSDWHLEPWLGGCDRRCTADTPLDVCTVGSQHCSFASGPLGA